MSKWNFILTNEITKRMNMIPPSVSGVAGLSYEGLVKLRNVARQNLFPWK